LNRITGERKIFDRIDIYNLFALARWNGRVVIGNHKGVGVLSGDSIQTLFPINGPIPTDPMAYNLLPLEPNVFGLTSCAGWIRLDLKNKTSDTLLRLPGYCVRTQTKIGKYVFIGTYGKGIYLYHQGKIKNIPLDKNGFLSYTHCFAPDKDGFVWMSTNRGLFKASVADMIAAFNNRSNSIYYHYYGRNDGMEMTELNGGCSPCAATLSDGTISFPSMDGLLWVNPSTAKPLLPDGPIYLDEIRIDDDTIGEADFEKIPIARGHRTILLRLGFSAWCNPENIYLEYQLNDQAKWIGLSVEQGPTIRLNNLSPGEYTLRIRKSNGFGENNFSVKTLRFRVGSAWYEHPLIYLLYLSILIFLINLFSKYQNRRLLKRQKVLENLVGEKTRDLQEQNELLEKNNRIKTRLISIISHDIVTPLKFLTVAGRGLKEKRSQLSEEEQRETISDMTQTAQELQLLSTNILNWIKYQNENRRLLPESVSPHLLTEQVFGLLGSLAKEKSIRLVNSIDPSWNIEQFAEPLKILIYNLVSNSIRYSDKGGIEVGATANRSGESTIWVADEGIGMNEDVIQHLLNETELVYNVSNASRSGHGLGYLIIKDLVKWMGGRIEIQSKTGRGTTVSVFIRPRRKSNAV
jgi:signal transduction histidine kinase